jgi:hypothetical protein
LQYIQKYAYLETLFLIGIFLTVGYLFSADDICLIQESVPYLLILLSIITLFHGFESGMLALGIIAIVMWLFYDSFPYVPFLVNLLMVMIYSEFHYYWTKQIKELRTSNDYKTVKLNELANAFYSLKISHDQLEKNYVLKPMSIRSAIEEILEKRASKEVSQEEYFQDFLALLEKSFHMHGGFIIYADEEHNDEYLTEENANICYSATSERYAKEEIFQEYLVDKAINYKQAVYVSDDEGNPAIRKDIEESQFLAAIPIVYNHRMLAVLVIEKMPFISFNKENLISLSILFEYLLISVLKQELLQEREALSCIEDKEFRYEYLRSSLLQQKYKTNSTVMIFKIEDEIQSLTLLKQAQAMLRSLDLLTYHKHTEEKRTLYYILFLFPLNDESAALGFLNRLRGSLKAKEREFDYMTFKVEEEELIKKYLLESRDNA